MLEPGRRFYSDLPSTEQEKWLALCRPHCASALLTPLTYIAYKYHPVT